MAGCWLLLTDMKNLKITILLLTLNLAACATHTEQQNPTPVSTNKKYTRENPYIPHGYNDHFGNFTEQKRADHHRRNNDTEFFRTGQRAVK